MLRSIVQASSFFFLPPGAGVRVHGTCIAGRGDDAQKRTRTREQTTAPLDDPRQTDFLYYVRAMLLVACDGCDRLRVEGKGLVYLACVARSVRLVRRDSGRLTVGYGSRRDFKGRELCFKNVM